MKLAPVDRALAERADVEHEIVHTGQHYDPEMSVSFFEDLWLPVPDHHLGVGSGSHAAQTAAVLERLEPVLTASRPDIVLVYGDVNSTLAAALVAAKLGIRVGHVEAGLRSRDWTMPEEINRVVVDRLSTLLFVPSRDAIENLRGEGVAEDRIHFVGNVMIDSLCWALGRARERDPVGRHGLGATPYVVATLHRPVNVDDPRTLRELVETLGCLSEAGPVLFPVHPRTRKHLRALGLEVEQHADLRLIEPLGYLEMLGLVAGAALVITDSGGLQEETSFLGVPCLTVRPNTERPVTCMHGTNRLVPPRRDVILAAARRALERRTPARPVIERWDGRAAERIAEVVCEDAHFRLDVEPCLAAAAPGLRPRPTIATPEPANVG
jgi:UDP-N-acetylglucosamine 2-epimerase (non-hydrolysing)